MPGRKRAAPAADSKQIEVPVAKRRSARQSAQSLLPVPNYMDTSSEPNAQSAPAKKAGQKSKQGGSIYPLRSPYSNDQYTVGWICAISTEYVAAQEFLDEDHGIPQSVTDHDNNDYALGKIGEHKVVIAVLPDREYGTSSAASVARDMVHSFRNVRIGLMVGIAGGAPTKHDIRLGDIVVSAPEHGQGGVFQYDFGKMIQGQEFQETRFLNQPPPLLRAAVNGLKTQYERKGHQLEEAINSILENNPRLRKKYQRPESGADRLFKAEITHKLCCGAACSQREREEITHDLSCRAICIDGSSGLKLRSKRGEDEDNPAVYYGLIGSANKLMKDAMERDRLAKEHSILCFEMEAAGLMNHFPCLVIRGICDYSDTHKNKEWQGYAAMAAAAYAKDLLYRIAPNKVEVEKRLSEQLQDVRDLASTAAANAEMAVSKLQKREDGDILNWLTRIDYGPQQSDYLGRRQDGTGQWLLDSVEFQAWVETGGQTLFCPGIPGAGKTILTSVVVDDLTKRFHKDPNVGIAYIYCNFRQKDEQKIDDLLLSLLKQLAGHRPSLPGAVKDLYNRHKTQRRQPSLEETTTTLHSVAAEYSRVIVIVDALDECQTANGCRERLLKEIFNLRTKSGANIFATSRFLPEIDVEFIGSIQKPIRANDEDVRRYINGHMPKLPKFVECSLELQKKMQKELQEEIKTEIVNAVDGMFLLAQLYLNSLEERASPGDVRSVLQDFRREFEKESRDNTKLLDSAHEQAMTRINSQAGDRPTLAEKVLSWIICAERPLSPTELQQALAVREGVSELNKQYLSDIDMLVSVCAGLVTIDEDSDVIRLVHYTTQEYFERTQNQWFPNAEFKIASICVTYLSFSIFESGPCQTDAEFEERLQLNQLYNYAAYNWGHHARKALTLCQAVIDFLGCQPKAEASSQALMIKGSGYQGYSQMPPRQVSGLHLAAYFGVQKAVNALCKKGSEVEAKDSHGRTPLIWAAMNGHKAIAQLLIDRGADIEAKDSHGWTPLICAAMNGHEAIAQLLIDRGADIEAKDKWGQTPLVWAAKDGHEAVVQLLVDRGAEVEAKDKWGQTPLLWAAANGHEAIAQLLVDRGADVEAKDKWGRTPLSWATVNGCEALVQLLVDRGADIEAKDSNGRTPLSWATVNGCEALVQLLVDSSADIEAKDSNGQTPLVWATVNGCEALVQLLVDSSADIEAKDSNGQTPLVWAAEDGHEAIAQLLVDRGADVEAKDKWGRTPLSWEAVVQLRQRRGKG